MTMDTEKSGQPEKPSKWYHGIVPVLIVLFVLGPFGFPLLWKSPRFNRFWKITLTILVILSAIYFVWGSWEIIKTILNEFKRQGVI